MSRSADTDAEKTKCSRNTPKDNHRTTRFCSEENKAHVNNGRFNSSLTINSGCIKDMGARKKKLTQNTIMLRVVLEVTYWERENGNEFQRNKKKSSQGK